MNEKTGETWKYYREMGANGNLLENGWQFMALPTAIEGCTTSAPSHEMCKEAPNLKTRRDYLRSVSEKRKQESIEIDWKPRTAGVE